MENTNKVERSELWNQIFSIVNQIPRKEDLGDAVDATSATTTIENLINSHKTKVPILRPISDLRNDNSFDLYIELCEELETVSCENLLTAIEFGKYYAMDFSKYLKLEEFMDKNNFDWKHNLIEKGLATSIHDVE
jgi:ribulose 1,5-bisphosphate carboxylase large subunit-like protein